jgi:hypothetical protein
MRSETYELKSVQLYPIHIIDGPVKSPANLSFRAKREIFRLQHVKKIRFLPAVEMTDSLSTTFYEFIIIDEGQSCCVAE